MFGFHLGNAGFVSDAIDDVQFNHDLRGLSFLHSVEGMLWALRAGEDDRKGLEDCQGIGRVVITALASNTGLTSDRLKANLKFIGEPKRQIADLIADLIDGYVWNKKTSSTTVWWS